MSAWVLDLGSSFGFALCRRGFPGHSRYHRKLDSAQGKMQDLPHDSRALGGTLQSRRESLMWASEEEATNEPEEALRDAVYSRGGCMVSL